MNWDLADPTTWSIYDNFMRGGVWWNYANPRRITHILFTQSSGDRDWGFNLSGSLDVSDFAALETLSIYRNNITELNVSNTSRLRSVNAGDNQFFEGGSLIMGKDDVYEVYKAASNVKIIAVHMEAVNHWALSREELKNFIHEKRITSNVLVPDDGESYTF